MADEGVRIKIDPLDVENYLPWSQKMKFLLISKDLWEGVEASTSHAAKSRRALALIGLNVKDHHLGTVSACATAGEAWQLLEKMYKGKTNSRKLRLRKEMSTLKMEPEEVVTTYVARAQDLYRDLIATGFSMTPQDLLWNVLAGLPPSFDALVTVLETQDEELEVETVLPKLIQHEQRQVTRNKEEIEESRNPIAFSAQKGRSGKGDFQMSASSTEHTVTCYDCGRQGHISRNCDRRKAREDTRECYKCGKKGHIARNCQEREIERAFTFQF